MTTIGDKFSQLGNSIINLVGTRASRDMNNLSKTGIDNIAALASGLPQNCISNVCTYVANEKINGNTVTAATLSGTFKGIIPAGKSTTGNPVNASIDSGEFIGEAINYNGSVSSTNNIELTLFVSSAADGHGVYARKYVASYIEPAADYNTVWYDLNENKLKIYIAAVDEESPSWVSLGSPSLYSRGTLINGALPLVLKIGRFTLNGTTMSNIIFDKNVQILDAGTISNNVFEIKETLETKIPVGTIISYMGSTTPNGYIPMDGRYLSTSTYSNLYSVIGDSQTTTPRSGYFQIADMTDGRYLMGSTSDGRKELNTCIQGSYESGYWANKVSTDTLTYQCVYAKNKANTAAKPCTITQSSTVQGNTHAGTYGLDPATTYTYAEVIPTETKRYQPVYDFSNNTVKAARKIRPTSITLTSTTINANFFSSGLTVRGMNGTELVYSEYFPIIAGMAGADFATVANTTVTIRIPNSLPYVEYCIFEITAADIYSKSAAATLKLICKVDDIKWELETNIEHVGETVADGLPNIIGTFNGSQLTDGGNTGTGAFYGGGAVSKKTVGVGGDDAQKGFSFDASRANPIYGRSETVKPVSLRTVYLIKY